MLSDWRIDQFEILDVLPDEGVAMRNFYGLWLAVGCLALGLWTIGCGPGGTDRSDQPSESHNHDDHDHADHDHADHDHADHDHAQATEQEPLPENLSAGIAELQQHYQAIQEAFATQDVDQAHGPLHEVGGLLEALPGLAAQTDLTAEEKALVESSATAMFDAYATVDGAIHDGQQPDYAAVSDKLDQAMEQLKEIQEQLQD
jgi:hypothetical protein